MPSFRGSSNPGMEPMFLTSPALAGGLFTTSVSCHCKGVALSLPGCARGIRSPKAPPPEACLAGPGWGHRLVVSINLQGQPRDYQHSSSL